MHAVEQRTDAAGHPAASSPHGPDQLRTETVDAVLRSPGLPLGDAVQPSMEAAFGTDFGDVRIHSDAAAARSAADVGAHAYTVGEHVVLGQGAGHHTLVHELAHVVQQRGAAAAPGPLAMSRPGDSSERAADAAAHQVASEGRADAGLVDAGLVDTNRRQSAHQLDRPNSDEPRRRDLGVEGLGRPARFGRPPGREFSTASAIAGPAVSLQSLQPSAGNSAVVNLIQRDVDNSSRAPDPDPQPGPGYQETKSAPSLRVRIIAHASPRWRGAKTDKDADANNLALSNARAQSVRQAITAQLAKEFPTGVSVDFSIDTVTDPEPGTIGVRAEGRGSRTTLPEAKGDRHDNDQRRRRVEVIVSSNQQVSGTAQGSQPTQYRSQDSEFWYVSVGVVASAGDGADVDLITLQLTNAATGETVDGRVVAVGFGEGLPLSASIGVGGSPTSFMTDRRVNFANFQNNKIYFTSAGVSGFFGYSRSYITFTGLGAGAEEINVSGFSAGTPNLGASTVFGFLTLNEPFPPRLVPIHGSDQTSSLYHRSDKGDDTLTLLFDTETSTVDDIDQAFLESFLSSVAAAHQGH